MIDLALPRIVPIPRAEPFSLLLSHDGLHAYLFCPISSKPRGLPARAIAERIHKAGIPGVLDFAEIQRFAESADRGLPPEPVLVARGTPAKAGPEGAWIFHWKNPLDGPSKDLLLPTYFRKGETVCERLQPSGGDAGSDVLGGAVPPPDATRPEAGDGLTVLADRCVADRDGFLVMADGRHAIEPDAHLAGAMLSFFSSLVVPRSVHVSGDVPPRTRIEAGRDITVEGDAGFRSKLTARGSVWVGGTAQSVTIKAAENVSCAVVLRGTLEAGSTVEIRTKMDERSRASAVGTFHGGDESTVANATIEALRGASFWSCGGACTVRVGLTEGIEKKVRALEAEIRKLARNKERVFEEFTAKYSKLLRQPRQRRRLSPEEQEAFERERTATTEHQAEIDAQISALKSTQNQLSAGRQRCYDAKVLVRHQALPPVEFWVRKRRHRQTAPLQGPFVVHETPDHRVSVQTLTKQSL
jgi:uncharacterized protein (DUF342 family)